MDYSSISIFRAIKWIIQTKCFLLVFFNFCSQIKTNVLQTTAVVNIFVQTAI